jgi:hypothetical protein
LHPYGSEQRKLERCGENKSKEGPSRRPRIEEKIVHMALTQLEIGNRTLQIEAEVLYFSVGELHEKINALGHINIVI